MLKLRIEKKQDRIGLSGSDYRYVLSEGDAEIDLGDSLQELDLRMGVDQISVASITFTPYEVDVDAKALAALKVQADGKAIAEAERNVCGKGNGHGLFCVLESGHDGPCKMEEVPF